MSVLEKNIQADIRLAASKNGCVLFRANAGMGWAGNVIIRHKDGSITIKDPRPFHGMIEGFPDLVGWKAIKVTPEMVGKIVSIIVLPEVKQLKGKAREAQERFKKRADKDFVVCDICRSVEDFEELVK